MTVRTKLLLHPSMLTAAGLHAVWLPACTVHQAGATITSSPAHFRGSRACGRPLRRTTAAAESGSAAPHFGADAPHFGATSSSKNFGAETGYSDTASLDDEAPHFGVGASRPRDARPQEVHCMHSACSSRLTYAAWHHGQRAHICGAGREWTYVRWSCRKDLRLTRRSWHGGSGSGWRRHTKPASAASA